MDITADDVAAIYDLQHPWHPTPASSDAFDTDFAMAAESVLDFGCSTGQLLHHLRNKGHHGRRAAIIDCQQEFDLAIMTGDAR